MNSVSKPSSGSLKALSQNLHRGSPHHLAHPQPCRSVFFIRRFVRLAEPKLLAAEVALESVPNARVFLESGFTTVRDVGVYRALNDVALRDAIAAGYFPGPRMFVAGAYITITGGAGANDCSPQRVPRARISLTSCSARVANIGACGAAGATRALARTSQVSRPW